MAMQYPFNKLINIDKNSLKAFNIQLINCITNAVDTGRLKNGDLLPSINKLSAILGISRDTVERSYKYLKKISVVDSISTKGYHITNCTSYNKISILLCINELSNQKKTIYENLANSVADKATIDVQVYNNDINLFGNIFKDPKKNYDYYVISPAFKTTNIDAALSIIDKLQKDKLILINRKVTGISGNYSEVYENLEKKNF